LEAKRLRGRGRDHVTSDERIPSDSEFVDKALSEAKEAYERKYEFKRRGYNVERRAMPSFRKAIMR
jgi:putative transposase